MDEWKKWLGRWWLTMGLAAFAVSGFMRWSDSELAQSEAMKTLDNTLMVIMVPLTLVLIVVRNVEVYRQSARLWWRRCRRWCWQLGACMLVIPTAVFAYKDKLLARNRRAVTVACCYQGCVTKSPVADCGRRFFAWWRLLSADVLRIFAGSIKHCRI